MDYQISEQIIPYFIGINNAFKDCNSDYRIGIYAPRNVCSRISSLGYSCSSFICDMSSGFSGNLGYPLPQDWAFDQIKTIQLGSGSSFIEVDDDIARGTYYGESTINPLESTIYNKINTLPLLKYLGIEFKHENEEYILIDSPYLKVTSSSSLGAKHDGTFSNLSIVDGKLDGASIKTAFDALEIALAVDKSLELANKLAKFSSDCWVTSIDFKVSRVENSAKATLEIPIEFYLDEDKTDTLTATIDISIEFTLGDEVAQLETALTSVLDTIEQTVEKNEKEILNVLIAIGVFVIVATLVIAFSEAIVLALGTIFSTVASIFGAMTAYFCYLFIRALKL